MIKTAILAFVLVLSSLTFAESKLRPYPQGPDTSVTPGDVCHHADEYRYPERIAYCNRNVDSKLKAEIIRDYDKNLGYNISGMDRQKFKIDHFIPLCMGGSNERVNLWPQHETVYKITDPLEPALCDKMAQGKILQAEAMDLIRQAKLNLDQVPEILAKINSL